MCGCVARWACRLVFVVVLLLAIAIGVLRTTPLPLGTLFAAVIPLSKGHLPPVFFGHGKMQLSNPPPVPADLKPAPRPTDEMFVTLHGTGSRMPAVGIGMCCRPAAYDDVLVERAIVWYLLQGGRLIDTASLYLNHGAIGRGVREAVKRGVPRDEIWLTTKVPALHFGPNVHEHVADYARELGVDRIDLVLLHMPGPLFPSLILPNGCSEHGLNATACRSVSWRSLLRAKQAGTVRNVGVSNFQVHHLADLADADEQPAVNQFEFNPWVPASQKALYRHCRANNIAVTAYYTLGGMYQKENAVAAGKISAIAKAHGVRSADVLMRWALQKGVAIIPGTSTPKHMASNLALSSRFVLTAAEMATIDGISESNDADVGFSTGMIAGLD